MSDTPGDDLDLALRWFLHELAASLHLPQIVARLQAWIDRQPTVGFAIDADGKGPQ